MIQYASSSYRDVILDKDVSADQAVVANKIMVGGSESDEPLNDLHHLSSSVIVAGGTGSDDPTQRSAPSTLNHGKPSSAEKGKTVVLELAGNAARENEKSGIV
ncbi:hypothetical protein L1049_005268 [Liquidambar formosana]|uniref:Uncharacterized protein n=1 Tax=Liquidambar formosana TaxID=63359 RepID=A0AAP0RPW7_LIQFO